MDTKSKQKLKRFIRELEGIRGRHTELVSVYIPAGYDMNKIINHLFQEQGTASNIKDKKTRDSVISSLERMIRHLRLFKRTPENGLAVFAGNVSDKEGQSDLKVFSMEPPEPLNTRMYRCDQTFVTDLLKDFLEEKEVYGLIVIDRREGTIGLLRGTNITEIADFTSNVPGKTTKGGQCLSKNSVVQINNGDLEKIGNLHNPYVVKSAEFGSGNLIDSNVIDKWDTKKNSIKIITQTPRLEIESSGDHTFFVRDSGVIEKSASELKVGDYLLMPEKINIKGEIQKLNFGKIKKLDENFAQFLGYYLGDGNSDTNRLVFYEENKELAEYYKRFFDNLFGLDVKLKYRKSKNYFELRIYSKRLFDFVAKTFPEIKKALDSEIPKKILKSPDKVVASFIRGLFDAEGYVTKDETSIGMNNRYLIKQLQMMLLRFGIIGSFCEYDNRRNIYNNNSRYILRITDKKSLIIFEKNIGFSYNEKKTKLNLLIKKRTNKENNRQILKQGKEIRKILEEYGYLKQDFLNTSNFFYNEREISKNVFKKNFIERIKKENKELYEVLKGIMEYNLIPVKIKSIEKSNEKISMSDISVKNQNFIANCVLVHNSQQRYARLREEAAHEFFKRVGNAVNKEFFEMKELKAILLGGPGHTKEDFLKGDYMHTALKNKVVGVKDLSYTGSFGLNELVDKSHDVLSDQAIIEEKKIMQEFFTKLATERDKVVNNLKDVKHALEMGAVKTLLLSETLNDKILNELEKMAGDTGSEVKIISTETREGEQLKSMGEVVAILRFPIY